MLLFYLQKTQNYGLINNILTTAPKMKDWKKFAYPGIHASYSEAK